jgi:hypothetical protein
MNSTTRLSWLELKTPFFPKIWNRKSAGPILTTNWNSALQYFFFSFQNWRFLSFMSLPVNRYLTETTTLQPASTVRYGSSCEEHEDMTICACLMR